MAVIAPFKALRPEAQLAKQVASPPYDVLNSKEAKIHARGNPYSFLHITKPEIDLPESTDPHSAEVYEKAKENLKAFCQRNVLFKENKPCYYIYQLVMDGRTQTGLVCCSSVDDYDKNIIKKHEFTRPEKEEDRINHMKTSGAQTGNVFLAYRTVEEIESFIEQWKQKNTAVYDFTADDGIRHTIWVISNDQAVENITNLFATKVPVTYIADGHHRAASAAKVRKAMGEKATANTNYFLTTLFPSSQLKIMDYNRLVKDLNNIDEKEFIELLKQDFEVEKSGSALHLPGYMNLGCILASHGTG